MPGRWAIAATGLAAIVVAAVAIGLLSTSDDGDEQRGQTTTTTPRETGPPGELAFSGKSLPGTLYLIGGADPLNAELYRVRGSLARAAQLTRQGRVSGVAAHDDTVVVSDARGSGADRVERLNLRAADALPGDVIDTRGQGPVYSNSGRLLYSVPQYADDGEELGDRVLVADTSGANPRQALRASRSGMNWGWGPTGQVAGYHEGSAKLVLDPGGAKATAVRPGVGRIGDFQTSSTGALAVGGPRDAIAVIARDRPPRVFPTTWGVLAWSPDARSVLVTRGDRIGLMSARTGAVREVGEVRGGRIYAASWVADETPIEAGS